MDDRERQWTERLDHRPVDSAIFVAERAGQAVRFAFSLSEPPFVLYFSCMTGVPDTIPFWYAQCMATEQIAVRLPQDLLARLDDLVRRGVYESRAAAVRAGVEAIAQIEQRRALDRSIVEGYGRTPQSSAEEAAALESLRQAIVEEPW